MTQSQAIQLAQTEGQTWDRASLNRGQPMKSSQIPLIITVPKSVQRISQITDRNNTVDTRINSTFQENQWCFSGENLQVLSSVTFNLLYFRTYRWRILCLCGETIWDWWLEFLHLRLRLQNICFLISTFSHNKPHKSLQIHNH